MTIHDIEICCSSIQSAENAKQGGAKRIELCQALSEGGTTPSLASIKHCVENLGLEVFVLIRPRGGDFCYNKSEIKVMEEDLMICKNIGVAGIVVGFLTHDKKVDVELTKRFVELASPTPVTFHRAFDECAEQLQEMETIIKCGCKRILTSGGKSTAYEAIDKLNELVKKADGRIKILAGSGITPNNVSEIITKAHVDEVHGSCKTTFPNGAVETADQIVSELLENIGVNMN